MLIAQLSDPHILTPGRIFKAPVVAPPPTTERVYADIDTAACLGRAVAALNALDPRPDVTVVTGDLCDHGEAAEYDQLAALLAPLEMPCFVIPGNHDDRDAMRAVFSYLPRDGFLHYAIDDHPVRIVALDTTIPGIHSGDMCAERLAWLEATLAAAPRKPTLVVMHHPPFLTGITYMDGHGLAHRDELEAVIARHPQVERIACGHLHRPIERRFAGTVAGTAPSTAHQIRLDLRPGARLHFRFEPPGYQLHFWTPEGGLVTHTGIIGEF
jgi:3',5'-cyclic AMP phosphodiesterase CpdA